MGYACRSKGAKKKPSGGLQGRGEQRGMIARSTQSLAELHEGCSGETFRQQGTPNAGTIGKLQGRDGEGQRGGGRKTRS